ncbi:hypothetical protein HYALB_00011108 [Hymenoscyphus albidus]|uniref:Uncharacterized protein n=1 Tax=Hymenoscyphus albidus TaxID=595503 RepID=A0A9N9LN97_9HELO|nr:hypothetical protein HYALB_00011108 [Hymenoscyphus albidus]
MKFQANAPTGRKVWDLNLVDFLFQHANPAIIQRNLTAALSTSEVNASLSAPLQALLKRLSFLSPPLKLDAFSDPEEIVVTRWLLLSYGGKNLWNLFVKTVMKQIESVEATIGGKGELEDCKGKVRWLSYYWEILSEDSNCTKCGGPLLEGEERRGGVEVGISNFKKGHGDGAESSFEILFGEIRRVVKMVEEVRKKEKGRVNAAVAEREEKAGEDGTDTSDLQPQEAASTTRALLPSVLEAEAQFCNAEPSLSSTNEVPENPEEPKLAEPPLSEEQCDETQRSPHESSDEPYELDEPVDTQDPQFYEASDHWSESDHDSEGSDEIPWASLDENNSIIGQQADSVIEIWETIHISEDDDAVVTVDEVPSETMDYEKLIFNMESQNRLVRANRPPDGLFPTAPEPLSIKTPPYQPKSAVFPAAPTPIPQNSSKHRDRPSSSQPGGNHGTHVQPLRESKPDKGKEHACGYTDREKARRRAEEEEEEKRRVLAWDRAFLEGKAAREKAAAHKNKQQHPRPTVPPTVPSLQNAPHPNHEVRRQDFYTYQHSQGKTNDPSPDPGQQVPPQQVYQANPNAHAVVAGHPKITMASWRTNLPGPNIPAPNNFQPRKSILKIERSEEEFSQMGRGRPRREPKEQKEVNFTRSSKYEDGGRDTHEFAIPIEKKEPPVELYD